MLNLFLAILLGNFDSARQLMAKKKAFEEFKRLHRKKVPLPIALEIVLGDLGEYVINHVLADDDAYINASKLKNDSKMKFSEISQTMKSKGASQKFFDTRMNEEEKVHNNSAEGGINTMNPKITAHFKEFADNSFGNRGLKRNDQFEPQTKTTHVIMNTANEQFYKSIDNLNREGSLIESRRDSQDMPANQQNGSAYDIRLNEQNRDLNIPDGMEDNKLSEIDDYDIEDSKNADDSKDLEQTKKQLSFPITERFVEPKRNRSVRSESVQPQEFQSSEDELEFKPSLPKRIWKYMKGSSLFIFSESFTFRQWLIMIVINTENLTTKIPRSLRAKMARLEGVQMKESSQIDENDSENSQDDINDIVKESKVYNLSEMKIVDGKIITTKNKIMISRWFENFIIFLIILNSLALVLDNPLENPEGTLSRTFYYFDIMFTVCFAIEAAMKIVAMGFFWNRMPGIEAYIMNGWNILDFVIVVSSLVDLFFTLTNSGANTESLKSLKALRAFRALRPLRVISRNEGLQIVVSTLFSSMPALRNVMMVMSLILMIFAIMGVNFFKGTFYYCSLDSSLTTDEQNAILDSVISNTD